MSLEPDGAGLIGGKIELLRDLRLTGRCVLFWRQRKPRAASSGQGAARALLLVKKKEQKEQQAAEEEASGQRQRDAAQRAS